MPSDFDIVFPGRERVKLNGGLNSKFEKQLIADNQSPELLNVVLGSDSAETRGGTAKANSASVGSFAGDGLYTRHDNDGSQTMVAWWNGTMYEFSGVATFTTVASAQSVYTAGERVAAAEYENYMFFGNGFSTPYKYNGDFTRHGIEQASAPTAATAPTGTNLSGDYQYKVSYVNSALVEGDVSDASSTFTASSEDIRVTIPTAPVSFGVESRRLYRTEAAGSTFKRVVEINDNSTTTYDDAVTDGNLGTTAPDDQAGPPNYDAIVYHQNRLFCNDPTNRNYVFYSELANPYVFKTTNFIRVGDNSGDIVRGLTVYQDGILVFCDNSQWLIYMPDTTPSNWQTVRIRSQFGSKSHFGTFRFRDKLMFPAIQSNKIVGFAAISGTSIEPSSTFLTMSAVGSELKSDAIEPDIFAIEESMVDRISAYVFKNKAYIAVAYGTNAELNNRIFVYDFSLAPFLEREQRGQEGAWVPWTGLNPEQFTEYNGKLYYISSDEVGFVYEMNTSTYDDDGSGIDSYIWTKEYSGQPGHETWTKDFRSFNFLFERSGDYFMNVRYRVDSDDSVGTSEQVDLDPGGSLWGTMRWGTDDWGGSFTDGEKKFYLANTRGRRIQFRFDNQNTAGQKFKVKGLNFIYNLKGRR